MIFFRRLDALIEDEFSWKLATALPELSVLFFFSPVEHRLSQTHFDLLSSQ